MSDGFFDSIEWIRNSPPCLSKDKDPWDEDTEINMIIDDLNRHERFPWMAPECDCGAKKVKTTHANWCSTKK